MAPDFCRWAGGCWSAMVGRMDTARARIDLTVTRRLDRIVDGATDHWLLLCNAVMAVYVVLPIAAPALMAGGWTQAANLIYVLYSSSCPQLPSHSWFPFGYQMAYCQRDTAIYL